MVKCLLKRPSKSRCGGSLKIFHIYNTIRICISFYSNESQEKHLLGKVASCVASEITKRTDPMRFRKLEVGKTKKMLLAKCTFLMRGLYNKRRKKDKEVEDCLCSAGINLHHCSSCYLRPLKI